MESFYQSIWNFDLTKYRIAWVLRMLWFFMGTWNTKRIRINKKKQKTHLTTVRMVLYRMNEKKDRSTRMQIFISGLVFFILRISPIWISSILFPKGRVKWIVRVEGCSIEDISNSFTNAYVHAHWLT